MKNYKVLNIALILSMILPAGVIPAYAFDFGSGAPALAPAADPQQQPGVDPNTPSNGTQTAPAVQQNTIVPKMTALEQMAQEDTRAVEPVSSGAEAKAADSKETSPATNAATPENTIVSSAPKTTEDNNSNDNRGASEKKSADSRIPVPTEKLKGRVLR